MSNECNDKIFVTLEMLHKAITESIGRGDIVFGFQVSCFNIVKSRKLVSNGFIADFVDAGRAIVITSHDFPSDKEAIAHMYCHTGKKSVVGGIIDCIVYRNENDTPTSSSVDS